jgi:leishmanolysin-like peptidase
MVLVAFENCEGGAIAGAAACNRDQYDRPIFGFVQFCLDSLYPSDEDGIFDSQLVVIHELGHALGHAINLFTYFRNETTGEPLTPRGENGTILERTVTCNDGSERTLEFPANNTIQLRMTTPGITGDERYHYEVVTPRVQTVVRNLFNCSTLTGARLENEATNTADCAGTHWHERQFFNALLSAYFNSYGDTGQADVLSPLTLALLEDSGWYKVSYDGIGNFPYGLALGCDFAIKDCIVDDAVPAYGKGIFCAEVNNNTDDMGQESGKRLQCSR